MTNGIDNAGLFIFKDGEILFTDSGSPSNPAFLNTGKLVIEKSLNDVGAALVSDHGILEIFNDDLDTPTKISTFMDLRNSTIVMKRKNNAQEFLALELAGGSEFQGSYTLKPPTGAKGVELILSGGTGAATHRFLDNAALSVDYLTVNNTELTMGANTNVYTQSITIQDSKILGSGNFLANEQLDDSLTIKNSQIGEKGSGNNQPVIVAVSTTISSSDVYGIVDSLDLTIAGAVGGNGNLNAETLLLKTEVDNKKENMISPTLSAEKLDIVQGFWTLEDVEQIDNGVLNNANWSIKRGRLTTREAVHTLGKSSRVNINFANGASWVNYNLKRNDGTLAADGIMSVDSLLNNGSLFIKESLRFDINNPQVSEEQPVASVLNASTNATLAYSSDEIVAAAQPVLSETIGSLNIDGNLSLLSDSIVEIEIGGLLQGEEYDLLSVSGDLTLGGLLKIQFIGDFLPGIDNSFSLIEVSGDLFSDFSDIELLGLDGLLAYDLEFVGGNLILSNITLASAVPLPATAWLLLSGLFALSSGSVRRKVIV